MKIFTIALLTVLANTCLANGILTPKEKAVVSICTNRTKTSWQGTFAFKDVQDIRTLQIEDQKEIYVIPYRKGLHVVIDIFSVDAQLNAQCLYEGQPNAKGDTPSLESIVVLPNAKQKVAEIIVSWRIPGNGGVLMIQKFRWDGNKLELSDQSSYGGRHDPIWRNEKIPANRWRRLVNSRLVLTF